MSFTLTRSRSRIDSSICRWRCGTSALASATTVRSSSVDECLGGLRCGAHAEQAQEALRDMVGHPADRPVIHSSTR